MIIDRCGQTAGLDPVRRHILAAGMAEKRGAGGRPERCMVCRQCGEQIGEHESPMVKASRGSLRAGGCGFRNSMGRFPITVQ